jgi:hypothetical protein
VLRELKATQLEEVGGEELGRQRPPQPETERSCPRSRRCSITRVAKDLGEDEDWLRETASEMEVEDGVIWVYGVGEDCPGENLIELIEFYKKNLHLLRR